MNDLRRIEKNISLTRKTSQPKGGLISLHFYLKPVFFIFFTCLLHPVFFCFLVLYQQKKQSKKRRFIRKIEAFFSIDVESVKNLILPTLNQHKFVFITKNQVSSVSSSASFHRHIDIVKSNFLVALLPIVEIHKL
jgi:hypothetical protein